MSDITATNVTHSSDSGTVVTPDVVHPYDSPEAISRATGSMSSRTLTFTLRHAVDDSNGDGLTPAIDPSLFRPVRNWGGSVCGTKPTGGLWLSVDGGWERWCEREMPHWLTDDRHEVVLSKDARIYEIRSLAELDALPLWDGDADDDEEEDPLSWGAGMPIRRIDFERMAETYDGVCLHLSDGEEGLYYALYGWDCDSVLLFTTDVIEKVVKIGAWDEEKTE